MIKRLRELCDERQNRILDEIYGKAQFFSKTNFNMATEALEELLKELASPVYVSPERILEKIVSIIYSLKAET